MKEIVTNPEKLKLMREKIEKEDYGDLHVLADFDRTLTYGTTVEGKKRPSLISVLRDDDYLGQEYVEKAHELFEKYHPIEEDPEIPKDKKKQAMQEWWRTHNELLIESGLTKDHFRRITKEGDVRFREGVLDFLDFLQEHEIPLIVISASGAGSAVPFFFEKHERNYSNIHFVVNRFEWDEDGRAVDYKEPIVHSLNKDETVLEKFPEIYEEIKDRKDVILLGDKIEDIDMIEGFDYSELLAIGFLCYNVEQKKKKFRESYDVVLKGDGDFSFIRDELFEIEK